MHFLDKGFIYIVFFSKIKEKHYTLRASLRGIFNTKINGFFKNTAPPCYQMSVPHTPKVWPTAGFIYFLKSW